MNVSIDSPMLLQTCAAARAIADERQGRIASQYTTSFLKFYAASEPFRTAVVNTLAMPNFDILINPFTFVNIHQNLLSLVVFITRIYSFQGP